MTTGKDQKKRGPRTTGPLSTFHHPVTELDVGTFRLDPMDACAMAPWSNSEPNY